MKIFNIRSLFATNSSSTHSILQMRSPVDGNEQYQHGFGFGWDDFILKNEDSKTRYLYATLYDNLKNIGLHSDYAKQIAASFVNPLNLQEDEDYSEDIYIDHQSLLNIPYDSKHRLSKRLNPQFVRDLYDYLMRSDVVICGGSDNDDIGAEVKKYHCNGDAAVLWEDRHGEIIGKKDGDVWVLFNQTTGHKLRFSFTDPTSPVKYEKASSPELVDMKITNHCDFGCAYCYQNSTPDGVHADYGHISQMIRVCANMGVFEIAFGGGDPTSHPRFIDILRNCRDYNIVPNFSTKSLSSDVLMGENGKKIAEMVGAIGVSVTSREELERAKKFSRKHSTSDQKVYIQYVCHSQNEQDFRMFCQDISDLGLAVIFLGFKDNGRGEEFKTAHPDYFNYDIPAIIKQAKLYTVGCDTAFLQNENIDALKLNPSLLTPYEGKFSMYIDCVKNQYGASSYQGDMRDFHPYNHKVTEQILKDFKEW